MVLLLMAWKIRGGKDLAIVGGTFFVASLIRYPVGHQTIEESQGASSLPETVNQIETI